MTPDLWPILITAAVGVCGIAATFFTARHQSAKQLELLHLQQAEERRKDLRAERRRVYGSLLSELTEIEASVDYFERLRKGWAKRVPPEQAELFAGKTIGDFDDVQHFTKLSDLAAQTQLVCSPDLNAALWPAIAEAMRAAAAVIARNRQYDVKVFQEVKGRLMSAMVYELRLEGYDTGYRDLLGQLERDAKRNAAEGGALLE